MEGLGGDCQACGPAGYEDLLCASSLRIYNCPVLETRMLRAERFGTIPRLPLQTGDCRT